MPTRYKVTKPKPKPKKQITTKRSRPAAQLKSEKQPSAKKTGEQPAARLFAHHVDLLPQTAAQRTACGTALVVADHTMRSAIELSRDAKVVRYIPHVVEKSYDIEQLSIDAFDQTYTRKLLDYPVRRAASLYVGFATTVGATNACVKAFQGLVTVPPQQVEQMRAVTRGRSAKLQRSFAKHEAAREEAMIEGARRITTGTPPQITKEEDMKKTAKKAPKKTNATKPEQREAKKAIKGKSAAARFKELILAGKLSDDEIFATVQREHGLDDSRRGYVSWYRNWLVKHGQLKK